MLAQTSGASEPQVFRKFILGAAVPVIFNGLRPALIFALLGVIGGESIASEHGLGQTLQNLASSFKTKADRHGHHLVIIWSTTALENWLLRWRRLLLFLCLSGGNNRANPSRRALAREGDDNPRPWRRRDGS
jgi:NitT/TauT family transport system permease protein